MGVTITVRNIGRHYKIFDCKPAIPDGHEIFTKWADALEKRSLLGELWPFYEQIDISKFNPEKSPPEYSEVQCNIYQTCDTGKILEAKEGNIRYIFRY